MGDRRPAVDGYHERHPRKGLRGLPPAVDGYL